MNDTLLNEQLANSGLLVAALDFRMPPEAPYPASLTDINYGIRWLKSRAAQLRSRSDPVGILGSSSGAHQAMLAAMRPDDRRYCSILLPSSAVPLMPASLPLFSVGRSLIHSDAISTPRS